MKQKNCLLDEIKHNKFMSENRNEMQKRDSNPQSFIL